MHFRTRSYAGHFGDENTPPAADARTFVQWLENDSIPQAWVDRVATRIIRNEEDLREASAKLSLMYDFSAEQGVGIPAEYYALHQQYLALWTEHQIHKFYAFLVPQLRAALDGFVKPVSLSVVRANSSVASFIQTYLMNDAYGNELRSTEGGYVNPAFLDGFAAFGFPPAVMLLGIAGGIIAVLGAVWAFQERCAVLRAEIDAAALADVADKEARGLLPPGTLTAFQAKMQQIKATENDGNENPFKAVGGVIANAGWLVAGLAALFVLPKVLDAFSSRRGGSR